MSKDLDELQVIIGLLVTASITASVAADRLADFVSEHPDGMACESLCEVLTVRVESFVSILNTIAEKLNQQAQP